MRILPNKSPSPSVYFAREITIFRSFVYSLVCGTNSETFNASEFLAGCNRYGIDNPCPIITKRLSMYGVPEELEKDFKKMVEKYKAIEPRIDVDPDMLGPAELKSAFMNFEAE